MTISHLDYLKKIDQSGGIAKYQDILDFAKPPLTRTEAIMTALRLDKQGFVTLEWINNSELGSIPTVRITEEGKLAIVEGQ